MKTFTRFGWTYWSDRIGVLVLCAVMGVVCFGAAGAPTAPEFLPYIAILCFAIGTWGFFRPFPNRIEIDDKEVRVFHRPNRTIRIPRSEVVRAKFNGLGGAGNCVIAHTTNGKTRHIVIGFGYTGNDGKRYPRTTVVEAINSALGIRR